MNGEEVVYLLECANMSDQLVDELELMYKEAGWDTEPTPRGWLAISMVDWIRLKEAVRG